MSNCKCSEEGLCDVHYEQEKQYYQYLKDVPPVFVLSRDAMNKKGLE